MVHLRSLSGLEMDLVGIIYKHIKIAFLFIIYQLRVCFKHYDFKNGRLFPLDALYFVFTFFFQKGKLLAGRWFDLMSLTLFINLLTFLNSDFRFLIYQEIAIFSSGFPEKEHRLVLSRVSTICCES